MVKKILFWYLIATALFLEVSCSKDVDTGTDTGLDYPVCGSFSINGTTNTVALVNQKMIYQTVEDDLTTFYALDLLGEATTKICTVDHFTMNGDAVYTENKLFVYITITDDGGSLINNLYRIDCETWKADVISSDVSCLPLISLYETDEGILALKVSSNQTKATTYFELIEPTTGKVAVVLEAECEETFVTASISDGVLYALAYKKNSDEMYDYYVNMYSLSDYGKCGTLSLDNIQPYMSRARIGELYVIGDYIFFNNYSNEGMICEIKENTATEILSADRLKYLPCQEAVDQGIAIFYIRREPICFMLDLHTEEISDIELPLKKGYAIRSMFADDTHILVKTRKTSDNKADAARDQMYLYDFPSFALRIH